MRKTLNWAKVVAFLSTRISDRVCNNMTKQLSRGLIKNKEYCRLLSALISSGCITYIFHYIWRFNGLSGNHLPSEVESVTLVRSYICMVRRIINHLCHVGVYVIGMGGYKALFQLTIRLWARDFWGDSWRGLRPRQLSPHRNLELII